MATSLTGLPESVPFMVRSICKWGCVSSWNECDAFFKQSVPLTGVHERYVYDFSWHRAVHYVWNNHTIQTIGWVRQWFQPTEYCVVCVCVCLLGSDWGSSSCVYQRSSHLGRQKLCVCCSITGESLNCQYAYVGSPNLPVRPTGYIDVQLAHVYQMDLFM